MDPMGLAQLKRQAEWHAEQVRHSQTELRSAELALENAKKRVEAEGSPKITTFCRIKEAIGTCTKDLFRNGVLKSETIRAPFY